MDRLSNRPPQNPSAMEIETSGQNSSSDLVETLQPTSRFAQLQLRREKRRTSENKLANPVDSNVVNVQRKLCDVCQQLIIIAFYDQHVLDCAYKDQEQNQIDNRLIIEDDNTESQEDQEQNLQNASGENQLQLLRSSQNSEFSPVQQAPENFFNLFGRFRNPMRNLQRYESSQRRLPSPSSFLSNIFNSIFHSGRSQERIHQQITDRNNQTTTDEGQQNQTQNETDIFPRGALLVRTIQPGPNGSIIVRMRVIPLDGLFVNPQETQEANEPQEGRLLGSLLNMLMTLHGIHGGGFGDFLNFFQEEKGLEKEVLDSLPLVSYDSETFKNVDDESKKCTICLDNFEDKQEVRFLWCLHRFHKNCVDQWLDKHTNCPICKKDYSEAVKDSEEAL